MRAEDKGGEATVLELLRAEALALVDEDKRTQQV